MKQKRRNNHAYIDGQNLYMGTALHKENPWRINLKRFRVYLLEKYGVAKAYYYVGYLNPLQQTLYDAIQEAGFILRFRKHSAILTSNKKGNVDTNIIFEIMKAMYKKENFDKILLVSGDGDYRPMVDFLIEENKFKKILFPNRRFASSLYKKITHRYFDYLENVKNIIEYKKGKRNRKGA